MSDETVKFKACKHLSFDRSKFVPSVKMNLISHFQETKVTWERRDFDGHMCLVQFCNLRGRLNHATACLNDKEPYACSEYEEAEHVVPLADIDIS